MTNKNPAAKITFFMFSYYPFVSVAKTPPQFINKIQKFAVFCSLLI